MNEVDIYLVIGIVVCILGIIAKIKSEIEYNNIINDIDFMK